MFFRGEDGAQLEMQKLSGSLGNLWKKWSVKMANRTDPYQVVIEATVGKPGNFICLFVCFCGQWTSSFEK